jgi:hypothetical protein
MESIAEKYPDNEFLVANDADVALFLIHNHMYPDHNFLDRSGVSSTARIPASSNIG